MQPLFVLTASVVRVCRFLATLSCKPGMVPGARPLGGHATLSIAVNGLINADQARNSDA